MMKHKLTAMMSAVAVTALAMPAMAAHHEGEHDEAKNIVETAMASDSFETLTAAVKAAGLAEALQGEGPFTVFAPTDEAFEALPEGTLESLLKPENKEKLVAILKYHVVSGKVMAEKAMTLTEAETLNGQKVAIEKKDDGLYVGGAKVVKPDVGASNGVIHAVDSVILPPEE